MEALGQSIQERQVHVEPPGAMKEHQGRAGAAFVVTNGDAAGGDRFECHRASASTGNAAGVTRFARGWHQKRLSFAYSGNTLRSLGITCSANKRVECCTLSFGMSPICIRQNT